LKWNGLPYVAMKQRLVEVIRTVPIDVISEAVGLSIDELALNDGRTDLFINMVEKFLKEEKLTFDDFEI
jgi:hypothetical protein